MKPELTCAIVRDLLPSYVEGLTSEETNQAVDAHLASCPDCKRLRTELDAPPETETAEQRREVDYLKTVKRRNGKRIVLAVVCTILLIVGGLAANIFLIGGTADVSTMAWETEVSGGTLTLNVMSAASANAYYGWKTERDESGIVNITAREVLVSAIHPDGSGTVQVPLDDGVREVWLLGKLVWQDGVIIDRTTLRVFDTRTPYIGNQVAVGDIARALRLQALCGDYTVSMHTSSRPYRWTAEFSGRYGKAAEAALDRDMTYVAFQMLALVDNMDETAWSYADAEGNEHTHVLTLEDANSRLAELTETYNSLNGTTWTALDSVKDYTVNPASFQKLHSILKCLDFGYLTETYSGGVIPVPETEDGGYHFVN